MKIWLRTGKDNLTHSRTVFGTSISYDELAFALRRMGIECLQEYPTGNAYNAEQHVPDNCDIEMWYGYPHLWEMEHNSECKGLAAYCRGGEMQFQNYEVLNRCDIVFVASESAKEYHRQFIDTAVPISVISGGFDRLQFYPIKRDFNANPFVFLHAGSTQWRKGSDIACEAFVLSRIQDVELLIMSPGETEMFCQLREKYSSDNRIKFEINPIADRDKMLSEYYARGHCLVYPSILEGWGRCLAEGMASGMPCLVTRNSSMLDQFNSDCGWWIELSAQSVDNFQLPDVVSLAMGMEYAYQYREESAQKGERAAKYARQYLTWEAGIGNALPVLHALYTTRHLKHIPSVKRLNIGCDMLWLDGWTNVDISARRIRSRATAAGMHAPEVYIHDLRNPLPCNAIEAVTVSHVLNIALQDNQYLPFLRDCYRVLVDGGVIRITDNNSDVFDFPSLSYTTATKMIKWLSESGFVAREVNPDETGYHDTSICIDVHGGRPKAYFVEGIK